MNTLLIIISLVLLSGLAWLWLHRAAVYGWIGEFAIRTRFLSKLSDEYVVRNDLLVKTADGHTHQIDHVIVSPYGIFVLETKAYWGKVYGGQYKKYWTEYLAGHGFQFYNPLRQNYGHVQALMEILELPEEAFNSLVVFGRAATLKVAIKNDTGGALLRSPELLEYIKSFDRQLITESTQSEILEQLALRNIQSKKNRQKHIASIKKYQ